MLSSMDAPGLQGDSGDLRASIEDNTLVLSGKTRLVPPRWARTEPMAWALRTKETHVVQLAKTELFELPRL